MRRLARLVAAMRVVLPRVRSSRGSIKGKGATTRPEPTGLDVALVTYPWIDGRMDPSRYPEGSLARRNAEVFNEEYERAFDLYEPSTFVGLELMTAEGTGIWLDPPWLKPDPNPFPPHIRIFRRSR